MDLVEIVIDGELPPAALFCKVIAFHKRFIAEREVDFLAGMYIRVIIEEDVQMRGVSHCVPDPIRRQKCRNQTDIGCASLVGS